MAAAKPYEAAPHIAVAVSGGADSMALCLLAHAWATARSGRILALTVDHGLRPASATEADWVGRCLAGRGIDHEILRWTGEKPRTGIEARARQARYRLLSKRCLARGILHLLVGHHLSDQSETVRMRAARGSAGLGLAAMSPVVETDSVRVIRPLLSVAPARLRAYLMERGQSWIEDPTNRDPAFARGRLRAAGPDNTGFASGLAQVVAAAADRYAGGRRRDEGAIAHLLAQHCRLYPSGHAVLDAAILATPSAAIVGATLARIATTIGGKTYPPGGDATQRLRRALGAGHAGSLGRCTWQWLSRSGGGAGAIRLQVLVCREIRRLPETLTLEPESELIWDGRFRVRVGRGVPIRMRGLALGALGEDGWRAAIRAGSSWRGAGVPRRAALSVPVLRDVDGLVAIPCLDWLRSDVAEAASAEALGVCIGFRPLRSLSGSGYFLA